MAEENEDKGGVDDTPGSDYPKMLYKGTDTGEAGYADVDPDATRTVANPAEEKAARSDGYAELSTKKAKADAKASS